MKSLLLFCLRRPLGVLAVYAALSTAGALSWLRMPRELLPDLSFPRLSVVTFLPNASPEEVENLVTKPIEQSLGAVKNVRRVDSRSKEHLSVVDLEFRWETDMDSAVLWVQEKLGLTQDLLPLEARKPTVLRYNPFDSPVVLLSVSGSLPASELQHLVETRVRNRLEKVSGVSAVEIGGALVREIQVDLDAQKLHANQLSVRDVADALRRRNVSRSAGEATEGLFEYPVTVSGAFSGVDGIREAVVRLGGAPGKDGAPASSGALLRLENLGTVTDGRRERTSYARYGGEDTISVGVYKRSDAFPVETAQGIRAALAELKREFGGRVRLEVVHDQSIDIKQGVSDVFNSVIFGGILACVVLWVFLSSPRRAVIVGATIPFSLLLTVGVMGALGCTMNLLTLGGLALGVGMIVDSAIVLMEDVSRQMDTGASIEDSVIGAFEEVGGGVFFSALTTVAAFAPVPLAAVGVSQRVFTPVCLAVVISQLASLLVGFTLLPSLISLFMKKGRPGSFRLPVSFSVPAVFRKGIASAGVRASALWSDVLRLYDRSIAFALAHRRRVLMWTAGATVVNAVILFTAIPRESMPDVDQEQFLAELLLPAGTRLQVTDRVSRRVEETLSAMPETARLSVLVGAPEADLPGAQGPHQARIVVTLADEVKNPKGRMVDRRSCRRVMRDARKRLAALDLEGGKVSLSSRGTDVFSRLFAQGGADLVIEVKGRDLKKMEEASAQLRDKVFSIGGVSKVEDSLAAPSPQMNYVLDELRLARDGLSAQDVAEMVLAAVHGDVATKFREKGQEVDVRVRLREEDRKDPAALARLIVSNPLDRFGHPLAEYGRLEAVPGPSEIRRRDQSRVILLEVSLSGRRLSDALPDVRRLLAESKTGGEETYSLGGEVDEAKASFQSLLFGFAAAVALVYIVLVAQFNALWLPLLAMSAVPLSINGVAPALLISGHTLNLMSGQGLMILAGIVVNNSLMLLEFIGHRRKEGMAPEAAAMESGRARLRPILMTVCTNLAGLLPLALGIGKGAQTQAPMAVTVIFGLAVSTVLTLIVMPVLYLEARERMEGGGVKP